MKTIAFLVLVSVVSASHANTFYEDTGWKLQPDRGGVYTVLPDQGRGGAVTSSCTTTSCTRTGGVAGPLGKPRPTLTPSSTFPKPSIGSSALGLGTRLLPWLSVGYGLYDWFNAAGLRSSDSGYEATSGGQQSTSHFFCQSGRNNGCALPFPQRRFATEEAARNDAFPPTAQYFGSTITRCGTPVIVTSQANFNDWSWNYCNSNGTVATNFTYRIARVSETVCHASGNVMMYPLGGLCPQGEYAPISESDALARLSNAPITADVLTRAFNETLQAGAGVASTGTTVSGPSSAPGETTTRTSTAANGTTQVSTTTTNYNYTYNDNRVTVTETKTTQNPDGSTETETTDQPKDECATNPDSLNCKQLGQENGAPTWETKTVLFQAENLGLSGSCPAPWVANLRGWNLTMSYQPVCDVAPTLRLGLLAVTALMCIFVVIRVTQS